MEHTAALQANADAIAVQGAAHVVLMLKRMHLLSGGNDELNLVHEST
jgi:hypothetical protein